MDPVIRRALRELESGLETLHPEPRYQWNGNQQASQREYVCDPADGVFLLFGNKDKQDRAQQRG